MDISVSGSRVTITGNIKSILDQQKIKSELDSLIRREKNITIDIVDSMSMTSSVIGYLNKLVLKDGVNITMLVGNEQLYKLLDELGLISTFNVKKR